MEGVIYVEEVMIKKHHGIVFWRAYVEIHRRNRIKREGIEGMKWLHRVESQRERQEVIAMYGEAIDRYYGVQVSS